jgi:hypothetical protein
MMMSLRIETTKWLCALVCIGVGCTSRGRVEVANTDLGIAELVTEDTADQTVVRGLDASGDEVARVELVHGRFTPSPAFADDFDTSEVDGRTLSVHVKAGAPLRDGRL